ncbi:ependymin-like [Brienomyrus brachyistius]|uniref:ependymin-like n=1 Tax=Brienomyrus brachyistius TaxID=42636 RepID=UPI0020B1EA4E|nr:ependymin-like [Brienomyrus brachyistius]
MPCHFQSLIPTQMHAVSLPVPDPRADRVTPLRPSMDAADCAARRLCTIDAAVWKMPAVPSHDPPPLLEGKFSAVISQQNMNILGSFSSDLPGRRFYLREEVYGNGFTLFEDILMLFSEKVMYVISYTNSTCISLPLNMDLHPMEFPPKAQYLNQVYIGSALPGEGVLADVWTGTYSMIKGPYFITTTSTGCLPISGVFNVETIGNLVAAYVDLVYGIEDPNVFTPPSFCKKAN